MTVTTTQRRVSYTGDGITTAFTFPFPLLAAAHLQVIRTVANVDTTLTISTDYSVIFGGSSGTVTLVAPLAVGARLTILRVTPATQTVDLVPGGPRPADVDEATYDKLTLLLQEVMETVARALVLPPSDLSTLTTLPAAALRAGKFMGFDGLGDLGVFSGALGSVTSVAVSGGGTGLTVAGGPITGAGTMTLGGTLAITNGGTGASTAGAARIAIGAGTVSSVDMSGGATGLTTSGGPITGTGTVTLGGTLAITNGGTGASTAAAARVALLPALATNAGRVLAVNAGTTDVEWITVSGTGTITGAFGAGGTTGLTLTGGAASGSVTLTLGGTLALANGGTGAATAAAARVALLPALAANAGRVLAVNTGTTDVEWITVGGTGTITGAFGAGGTTGLTLTGGAASGSVTLTLGGTLALANGGTGVSALTANALVRANAAANALQASIITDDGFTATVTGGLTVAGAGTFITNATSGVTLNSSTAAIQIAPSGTSCLITVGGVSSTGTITLGRSTLSQTTNIQAGATASASVKAINFGTGGLSGSTTTIAIGSSAGNTTVAINGAAFTPPIVLTVAATTTLNCAQGNVFTAAMTLNVTTLTVSNPNSGQTINVRLTQDATGGRTITWPAAFKWSGGLPVLSTAGNAVDLLTATYFADTARWEAALSKGHA